MTVFLVVEWIDGIPETIKVYADREGAENCIKILGGQNMTVQERKVH